MTDEQRAAFVKECLRKAEDPALHWTEAHGVECRRLRSLRLLDARHLECALLTERPKAAA